MASLKKKQTLIFYLNLQKEKFYCLNPKFHKYFLESLILVDCQKFKDYLFQHKKKNTKEFITISV